jgi:hypothetical protein
MLSVELEENSLIQNSKLPKAKHGEEGSIPIV